MHTTHTFNEQHTTQLRLEQFEDRKINVKTGNGSRVLTCLLVIIRVY